MEKWAKTMNTKKEPTKKPTLSTTNTASTVVAKPVELVHELVELNEIADTQKNNFHSITAETTPLSLSFSVKNQTDQPSVTVTEEEICNSLDKNVIDIEKMACLLCKRKFDSVDILNKHVAKSELHKVKFGHNFIKIILIIIFLFVFVKKNLEKLRSEKKTNDLRQEDNSNSSQPQSETSMSHDDSLLAALKFKEKAEKELKIKVVDVRPISPTSYGSSSRHSRSSSSSKNVKSKYGDRDRDEDYDDLSVLMPTKTTSESKFAFICFYHAYYLIH